MGYFCSQNQQKELICCTDARAGSGRSGHQDVRSTEDKFEVSVFCEGAQCSRVVLVIEERDEGSDKLVQKGIGTESFFLCADVRPRNGLQY